MSVDLQQRVQTTLIRQRAIVKEWLANGSDLPIENSIELKGRTPRLGLGAKIANQRKPSDRSRLEAKLERRIKSANNKGNHVDAKKLESKEEHSDNDNDERPGKTKRIKKATDILDFRSIKKKTKNKAL